MLSILSGNNFAAVDTEIFRNQVAPLVVAPAASRRSQHFYLRGAGASLLSAHAIAFGIAFDAKDNSLENPRVHQLSSAISLVSGDPGNGFLVEPFLAILPSNTPLEVSTTFGAWNGLRNENNRFQVLGGDVRYQKGATSYAVHRSSVVPLVPNNSVLIFGLRIAAVGDDASLLFSASLHGWRWDEDIRSYDPNI